MTDSTPASQQPPQPTKPPLLRRAWFIVLATVVLLIIIIIAVSSGDETPDSTTDTTTGAATPTTEEGTTETDPTTTDDAAITTAAVTTTAEVTTATTEASATTEEPTTTQPQAEATPRPVNFEGSGSDVIQLEGPGLTIAQGDAPVLRFEMNGGANNVLWLLDSNVEQTALLVNTIGPISGNRVLSLASSFSTDIAGFEIESEGAWNLTLLPLVTVTETGERTPNVRVFDEGGEVTVTPPTGLILETNERVADVSYNGDMNIVVLIAPVGGETVDLLVNEIGNYEATVRLPDCSERCVLDIDGQGGELTISIP